MDDVLIKTVGIAKEFSGVYVLKNINLEIRRGEIFGIIGENGAGKSTFIKILSGTYTPSEGQIHFEGRSVQMKGVGAAKKLGITAIPQEINLIDDLNVYENIFLGKEYRARVLLDRKRMMRKTGDLLRELQADIPPEAKIQRLSVAQKQMVEIAKAMADDAKLLIMDEPTAVLTQYEIEILFRLMRRLKEKGVTIIYISHKLKEVKHICDRVMILRDGEFISLDPVMALDEQEMARRMVGRELTQIFPEKIRPRDESVLRVENLAVKDLLHDISFDLRKGEILGFAGLVGAGRTEMAETLIGVRRKDAGRIFIHGRERAINTPVDAVRNKLAYLSEDRQGIGIITSLDLTSNVTLVSLRNYGRLLINGRREREKAQEYVRTFDIKAASLATRLEYLSGGNQQKVSLSKSLDPEPEIVIIDEPTRGIDVSAKKDIYYFIQRLVQSGLSCILISCELEEIIGLCHRVVVMREGHITGILEGERINEEEIMYHATGLKGGVA